MINYLAVLIAAIVFMIIGSLWYSPLLFGKLWMKLSGLSKKDIDKAKKKGMGKIYLAAFIGSIITALVLEYLIDILGYNDFITGAFSGLIIWIFIAVVMLNGVLWEGKSVALYLINILYQFVALILTGGILGFY